MCDTTTKCDSEKGENNEEHPTLVNQNTINTKIKDRKCPIPKTVTAKHCIKKSSTTTKTKRKRNVNRKVPTKRGKAKQPIVRVPCPPTHGAEEKSWIKAEKIAENEAKAIEQYKYMAASYYSVGTQICAMCIGETVKSNAYSLDPDIAERRATETVLSELEQETM